MKNLLLFLALISSSSISSGQTPNPPHMVKDPPQGWYTSVGYERASNGTIYAMDSYIYVKNIGGSGEINVTVTVGKYIENKQFAVDSDTRYELISRFPVSSWPSYTGIKISATFSGTPSLTVDNSTSISGYYPTDTSSSIFNVVTSVATSSDRGPRAFRLNQNYPNPINSSTIISYELAMNASLTLRVFDVLGREVRRLLNEDQSSGTHLVRFDATDMPGGVYFYRLQAGAFTETKRLVVLK